MNQKKMNLILFITMYLFVLLFSLFELLPFKILACICFVTVAMMGLSNKRFSKVLFTALCVATIGDIVIFYSIIPGILIFALGHLFYAGSYFVLQSYQKRDLLCTLGLFAFAVVLLCFTPFIVFDSKLMQCICLFYSAIISVMAGKAISNMLTQKSTVSRIICWGSIFFFLSDLCVVLNSYATIAGPYRYIGRVLYFGGQFLLAWAICLFSKSSRIGAQQA